MLRIIFEAEGVEMKDVKSNSLLNLATKILFLGFLGAGVIPVKPCFAQSSITPDNTLDTEASQVTPNVNNPDNIPSELLEGGAQRGQNLFHSFQEFNVNEGRGAYFLVPNNTIQNVLTRVTGNNPSQILGTLGTISNRNFDPSNVNLFLINPNGIVFGQNASLDINGSFVGTTANILEFGERGFFSATNPQAPSGLLTVNPSAFLFNQVNTQASIQSTSVAPAGQDLSGNTLRGLRVGDGNSLLLLGDNLSIDGQGQQGGISAIAGRVELGGYSSTGTVGLNVDGNNLSLSFPDNVDRGDVSLSNGARVNVRAGDGGNIAINSRNVEITQGSQLIAGITSGFGSPETQAGNIEINAAQTVAFDGVTNSSPSGAFNQIEAGGTGNSGRIEINAGSVEVKNGAQLNTSALGRGNSGTIRINATDKVLFDGAPLGFQSSALSQVGENAVGNSGGVEINASNVEILDGGYLEANTLGIGDAGKIQINAGEKVVIDGESPLGFLSAAFSQVGENAVGNSGGVEINAGNVEVTNGGQLNATTLGKGNAGLIRINATDKVAFEGVSPFGVLSSAISQVFTEAEGDSQGIEINGSNVEITGGAQLTATTLGKGDSGKISITGTERVVFSGEYTPFFTVSSAISQVFPEAEGNSGGIEINGGSVEITGGAQLTATTLGKGNSGLIRITGTERVVFDGESTFGFGPASAAISQVFGGAEGNSGGIEINGGNIEITNGAQLTATTLGKGNSGLIRITGTDRVVFEGESTFGPVSSAISQVFGGAEGNSGGIEIEAGTVNITNGAFLDASTLGKGNAGAVRITGRDRVVFDGESSAGVLSSAFSQVTASANGDSGGIVINTGTFEATKGAQLTTTTFGQGNSGQIQVTATDKAIFDGKSRDGSHSSNAASQVQPGAVGNSEGIKIDTSTLELSDTAFISANTLGDGQAGDITVNSTNLNLTDGSEISARSEATGIAGDINLNVNDNFNANNGKVLTQAEQSRGGNINIATGENIILRNNSDIRTTLSTTTGSGGNITLNANAIVALEDSDILAFAPEGRGGNITFNTRAFFSESLFSPTPQAADRAALDVLDGNNRVDINATGSISSGTISGVTDPSFLQDDLTELAENPIDSEALVASSCVVRSRERNGTFFITGTSGLPYRPGDAVSSKYSAVEVQPIPNDTSSTQPRRRWKIGDPIMEPTGVYSLDNGRQILSRECGK